MGTNLNIPASEILKHIHPDAVHISLRTPSGNECQEITVEDLKALIASEHVEGIIRRGKLHEIRLTVPPDVAFRELGETRAKIKDQLHCDANVTVIRSADTLPGFRKQHHRGHCLAWNETENRERAIVGAYQAGERTKDIESSFGLSWTGPRSLTAILRRRNEPLRRGEHGPLVRTLLDGSEITESVECGLSRLRIFKPSTWDERIALYRRAWGMNWQPSTIGL
jgi:hypothetical protein